VRGGGRGEGRGGGGGRGGEEDGFACSDASHRMWGTETKAVVLTGRPRASGMVRLSQGGR
jgi:hypothetical protein